jgi:arabinose-5-phosphate isomerase
VLAAEAEALHAQASALGAPFTAAVDRLFSAQTSKQGGRIVCTGMGKSGHVARKIAATFASTGSPAFFVHPAEASHGDLGMIGPDDVIIALSKSGEAPELADMIAYATRFAIPLIAITAEPGSALGQAADVVLQLAPCAEATAEVNAPTTSTTLQLALGDALAVALLERRGFKPQDFRVFHPGGRIGAMLATVGDLMHGADELPLVSAGTKMEDALLVMTEKRWGIVGVVAGDGRLEGAITDGDLRRHIDGLFERSAGEVMTAGPKTAPPWMLAAEALKTMTETAPSSTVLFVVEAARPVGILHIHDLVRAGVI